MRIESKGIVISEIFETDDGETIEICADGSQVTLNLLDNAGSLVEMSHDVDGFRQLLAAMKRADQEINQIENPTAAA